MSGVVPGPVAGARMTEDYVRSVGRRAYLWGWPLANMHNRLSFMEKLAGLGLLGGWSRRRGDATVTRVCQTRRLW